MRLSNKRKIGIYQFIGTAVIVFVIASVFIYFADRYILKSLGWKSLAMILLSLLSILIFYWRGKQIFEYDSDGETLILRNRSVLSFLGEDVNDEFPKYKILSYDIVNALIFKRLYIHIYSKKSQSLTLKYHISYLTDKEIRDLKISLQKVIKNNAKAKGIKNHAEEPQKNSEE